MQTLTFWYEFASTYSYPAAMRIDDLAAAAGVLVRWQPILLGPIFREQGWETSPFNVYPAKGAYMWRDLARICAEEGLAFSRPVVFPQNGLKAARIALIGQGTWGPAFARAVYRAEFASCLQIDDEDVLRPILRSLDADPDAILLEATSSRIKLALRDATSQAAELGIFGAPSFTASDGELFWGNDRLEQAIRYVANQPG